MYYIYIIKSIKTNRMYCGYTSDLKRRYAEHNKGIVRSTKAYIPWKLMYYEGFSNKTDALQEELFLKSGKGKERVKHLLKNSIS